MRIADSRTNVVFGQIVVLVSLIIVPLSFVFNQELVAAAFLVLGTISLAYFFPRAMLIFLIITCCISLSTIHSQRDVFAFMGGANANGIQLFLSIAIAFPVVAFRARQKGWILPKVMWVYIAFLVWITFSLLYTPHLLTGLRLLFKLLYPLFVFVLYKWLERQGEVDEKWLIRVLLWTFIVTTSLIYITYFAGIHFISSETEINVYSSLVSPTGFFRFSSSLGYTPNPLGLVMAVATLIAVYALLKHKHKLLATLSMFLTFIIMFLTYSRMAFATFFIAVIALLFMEKKYVYAGITLLLCVLLFFLTPYYQRTFFEQFDASLYGDRFEREDPEEGVLRRGDRESGSGDRVSLGAFHLNLQGRELFWVPVWSSFVESPIVGHGLGSSEELLKRTYPNRSSLYAVHNDYLRIAADTGLIGLILFVVFIGVMAGVLWQLTRRGSRMAPLGLSVLTVYVLSMLTDNTLDYYRGLTFLIFICLAISFDTGSRDNGVIRESRDQEADTFRDDG